MQALLVLVAVATSVGLSAGSAPPAAAAAADIDPSSCGQQISGPITDYCAFETDGTDVVIGPNSCNGSGACVDLGNGARINPDGNPGDPGSCNAEDACPHAGALSGSVTIGAASCNDGRLACKFAGYGGLAVIGDHSCDGEEACGNVGGPGGNVHIGDYSCTDLEACLGAAINGIATIGDHSCNGPALVYNNPAVCKDTGSNGGNQTIGNYSCNQPSGDFNSYCVGPSNVVGDCQYNDEEPVECIETLVLRSYLFPFWDGGRFYLSIQGIEENLGPYGNNGATGPIEVDPGQPYTIYETGAGNTSLGNYRTTILCHGSDGSFVSYGFSTSLTLQLQAAQHVTCTFINQRIWSWFWWR